jgi:hypothetical protein
MALALSAALKIWLSFLGFRYIFYDRGKINPIQVYSIGAPNPGSHGLACASAEQRPAHDEHHAGEKPRAVDLGGSTVLQAAQLVS